MRMPAIAEGAEGKGGKLALRSDSQDPLDGLVQPESHTEIDHRRDWRSQTGQIVNVTENSRSQRGPVHVLVVREKLGLDLRHIDARRTFRLASLARQAE